MAPTKSRGGKSGSSGGSKRGGSNSRGGGRGTSTSTSTSTASRRSTRDSKTSSVPLPSSARKQVKTHRPTTLSQIQKKKAKGKRQYTAEELGVPTLNGIVPAGVQKPRGKKKGKRFVDDPASMMTILAMVNADQEGQIESKMVKARKLEELREARAREMEQREEEKKEKLEKTKKSLRGKKSKGLKALERAEDVQDMVGATTTTAKEGKVKKKVSFG